MCIPDRGEMGRPRIVETTALGVAMLAAHVCGGATAAMLQTGAFIDTVFSPRITAEQREEMLFGWHTAVARARFK